MSYYLIEAWFTLMPFLKQPPFTGLQPDVLPSCANASTLSNEISFKPYSFVWIVVLSAANKAIPKMKSMNDNLFLFMMFILKIL